MSNKTIAKFSGLVIFVVAASAFAAACSHASPNGRDTVDAAEFSSDYEKPVAIGRIESGDVTESSGLAASLCQPNVFWTHNDSGDDAFIFAMTSTGKHLGIWRVANARNTDWEDIAEYKTADGTCYLYIGDIGNNKLERVEDKVYRVREPLITDIGATSNKKNPLQTEAAEVTVFKYPDTPHNAETMTVQPQSGDIYVLTKRLDGPSLVFKIKPQFGATQPVIAEKVGEISVPAVPNGLLTGGSISQDGKRVFLCDYSAGYELDLGAATDFDDVWERKPIPVDLGDRKHGEAVTFGADGKAIFGTSEGKNAEIFEVKRK
jgi:hypothetical protein